MSKIELREASPSKLVLRGYASTFDTYYQIGGGAQETIVHGAFSRTLSEDPDVALLIEHQGLPLGRTARASSKPNLSLTEDSTGLFVEADLNPADPRIAELRAVAEHSDLQMSFSFKCTSDSWNEDFTRREVKGIGLHRGDVTICTYGANEETSMAISERGNLAGLEQRRAFAESLKGMVAGPSRGMVVRRRSIHVPDYTKPARQEYDLLCAHEGATKSVSAKPSGQASPDLTSAARRDLERLRKG